MSGLELNIKYSSPEFSGTVFSDVSCSGPSGFSCYPGQFYSFTTKVVNLYTLLADDLTYRLIGSTASHRDNHWGSASFISKLQNLALLYYLKYEGAADSTLSYNDVSLRTGGRFDVYGDWSRSHKEHRIGVVADMWTPSPSSERIVKQLMKDVGITGKLLVHVLPDPPHWHMREYNSGE